TLWLLTGLVALFGAEHVWAPFPGHGVLSPDVRTLLAFGGLERVAVLEGGHWYRLVTAPLLHAGLAHLFFNGLALAMAGVTLEGLVGRPWLFALLVLGGLGGGVVSLLVNPAGTVSVGASGAIMAVLAAAVLSAFRLPAGAARSSLQQSLMRLLIPS